MPPRVRFFVAALGVCALMLLPVAPASASPGTRHAAQAARTQATVTDALVPVRAEPDGTPVRLDTSLFVPGSGPGPHPAVILAHGFGGSKADLSAQAGRLADQGYVVLTYSARGFGRSGGRIHLNDPAFEIADAMRLVDLLAARSDVATDAPNDPRVAVVGGSYGGALALMLAATDPRVDADVALITWNDLAQAFFPQSAVGDPQPGPFKQLWASRFFTSTVAAQLQDGGVQDDASLCGRFDPTVCEQFRTAAETGQPTAALLRTLAAHSPAPMLKTLRAPTLLIQGEADSLFGLDQATNTFGTLRAQGTEAAMRWSPGGHDSADPEAARLDEDATLAWLGQHLSTGDNPAPSTPVPVFSYALPPEGNASAPVWQTSATPPPAAQAPGRVRIALDGKSAEVLTPPGGEPSSITGVPGVSSANLPTYQLAALPGQFAAFDTSPLDRAVTVVGSPQVRLAVTSTGSPVTLFVSLWQVQGRSANQQRPLVAPVRLTGKAGVRQEVLVDLPANVYRLGAGSTWRVLVTSTDSGFSGPTTTRLDRVSLASPELSVPEMTGAQVHTAAALDTESLGVGAAILALLAAIGTGVWWYRRGHPHVTREDLADVPLVVESLVKTYSDGHRAVDDVSWRAERGQVVGLLGPNGAGKTTTIRMLLGLITPDSGTVHVLGEPVHPGAPVLARVGALVEGPGFLPHLSGRQNLHAYWAATGRPQEEAGFEEALEVAALGNALERPVRTYSHGMRQRLGIAQAMLGRPDLLFLDEPTNGLDPPQIAAMRPILHAYAATGRTVVVSSHLLGEVEQTCSHVVVMHAGRVITAGAVDELVASSDTTVLTLVPGADVERAAEILCAQTGITHVETIDEPARVTVVADLPRAHVIRLAVDHGIEVSEVGGRRHLEEVFLGVIANAQSDATPGRSLNDRLRQVRAR